jgi:predicted permease
MPAYTETIIYIFALIALGYISVAFSYFKAEVSDNLTAFIYKVGVPLLLFKNTLYADFQSGTVIQLWSVYFGSAACIWAISHLTIQKAFRRDARAGVVAGVTGAFSNSVLVGIPFVSGVYGDDGMAVLSKILTIHLPVMLAATIIQIEWASRRDGAADGAINFIQLLKNFIRQLLSNPLVIGVLAGFTAKIIGFYPPSVANLLIDNISATVGPIALFALGMAVSRYGIAGQIAPALSLVFFKLMLMPAFVLCVAILVGMPDFTTKVAVSIAGLPAGINAWVVSQQFGTGQRLAATSITIGTGAAIISTSLWLLITNTVLQLL